MPTSPVRRRSITVVASVAVVVAVAAGATAIGWLSDSDDDTVVTQEPSAGPTASSSTADPDDPGDPDDTAAPATGPLTPAGGFLPEPMGGQEAIDELGENLERVATINDMSAEELRELLLRDQTLRVSPDGHLFYVETATPPSP
ncbi:hypothetical protein [Phytoactinopolyspora endophytica]|uniref:hypothetical protein n=1 Tax=Phytoactinopolyspora endophytica TaxID=1642495 RepID=UPI00101C992A|nr:hypothetical protein [Phytoactinopolyspora endophytica]